MGKGKKRSKLGEGDADDTEESLGERKKFKNRKKYWLYVYDFLTVILTN